MKRVITFAMVMFMIAGASVFADNITLVDKKYDFWKNRHPNQKVPFVGYIQYSMADFKEGKIRLTLVDEEKVQDVMIESVDMKVLKKWLRSAMPERVPALGDNLYYLGFPVSVLTKIKGKRDPVFQYIRMKKVK